MVAQKINQEVVHVVIRGKHQQHHYLHHHQFHHHLQHRQHQQNVVSQIQEIVVVKVQDILEQVFAMVAEYHKTLVTCVQIPTHSTVKVVVVQIVVDLVPFH